MQEAVTYRGCEKVTKNTEAVFAVWFDSEDELSLTKNSFPGAPKSFTCHPDPRRRVRSFPQKHGEALSLQDMCRSSGQNAAVTRLHSGKEEKSPQSPEVLRESGLSSPTLATADNMEPRTTYQPFVYWAQSQDQIFLRVELEAKSKPEVATTNRRLEFSCDGTAPTTGRRNYAFAIDFHEDIIPGSEGYRMEVLGSKIQFFIDKFSEGFWPQLMQNRSKPAWLKIDFDRFQSGDPETDEEKDKNADPDRDPYMRNSVDELLKDLKNKRPQGFSQAGMDFRKMYLTAYNTFMLLINFGIVVSLIRNFVSSGTDVYDRTYHLVGLNVRIMQTAQIAEVIHSVIGLVPSNPLPAALQVGARLFALHVVVFEPYLQTNPAVFWVFLTWSAIELVRYPYYLCQLHGVVPPALKFLRYTSWMVLYPLGMILEIIIFYRALEVYPVSHPGPIFPIGDSKVSWSHVIGAYLCLFPVGCLYQLRYMFKQTKSQLFPKKGVRASAKTK